MMVIHVDEHCVVASAASMPQHSKVEASFLFRYLHTYASGGETNYCCMHSEFSRKEEVWIVQTKCYSMPRCPVSFIERCNEPCMTCPCDPLESFFLVVLDNNENKRDTRDTDLTWKPLREKTTDARRRIIIIGRSITLHERTNPLRANMVELSLTSIL